MDLTLHALTTTGALILDMNDPAAGYKGVVLGDAERVWDRRTSGSPWWDGDVTDGERLESVVKPLRVRIRGNTWAQVQARKRALVAAVETRAWVLRIGIDGDFEDWRAAVADSSVPIPPDAVVNRMLVATLSVPCQPTPTVTVI